MLERVHQIQSTIKQKEREKMISKRDGEDYDLASNIVVKSNSFARGIYDLTLIEKRVLEMMISQLDSRLDYTPEEIALEYAKPEHGKGRNIFSTYITAEEYSTATGVKIDGAYLELKRAAKTLKTINISIQEDDVLIERSLMTDCAYVPKSAKVYAVFHQKFLPHLVALKSHFTKYHLKHAMKFKSIYSWRLYELMMSYNDRKNFCISVEDLSKTLSIPKSYKWSNVQKLLDAAREEINEHLSIELEVERLKTGKKITSLHLRFKEAEQIRLL